MLAYCTKHMPAKGLPIAQLNLTDGFSKPAAWQPQSGVERSDATSCPAGMCPLLAKNGSPHTGVYDLPCPENDNIFLPRPHTGCPWWSQTCSCGGVQKIVDMAESAGGKREVNRPNKPRRTDIGPSRSFDCPRAARCSWQKYATAESGLCAPRDALRRGIDPRVCLQP
jgi:hypothetical protein